MSIMDFLTESFVYPRINVILNLTVQQMKDIHVSYVDTRYECIEVQEDKSLTRSARTFLVGDPVTIYSTD